MISHCLGRVCKGRQRLGSVNANAYTYTHRTLSPCENLYNQILRWCLDISCAHACDKPNEQQYKHKWRIKKKNNKGKRKDKKKKNNEQVHSNITYKKKKKI